MLGVNFQGFFSNVSLSTFSLSKQVWGLWDDNSSNSESLYNLIKNNSTIRSGNTRWIPDFAHWRLLISNFGNFVKMCCFPNKDHKFISALSRLNRTCHSNGWSYICSVDVKFSPLQIKSSVFFKMPLKSCYCLFWVGKRFCRLFNFTSRLAFSKRWNFSK